ncbi:hypothetical protein SRB5_57630 [Streptomyces sp. RB5]|uniref:Uncharacterized protein n=1 Tax=Streptomyces smaragdinus TaxID=2585196 RepID=A0A7K0CQ21_9ACTN|nr:Ig-like domain-containing protein [Streptomyces smaragdinus]MQY15580.1 hypothetical protein [Streptomyces smaragdinus]
MTTGPFLVARMRSVQKDNPAIICNLELTADTDPRFPVRPGASIGCELTLTPEGAATRYYGYLMVESFETVASLEKPAGITLLPKGGRYATSTGPGEVRTAKFVLKIHENAARGAFLVPKLRAAVIADGGKSLTSTTFSLKDKGFRIAPLPPLGRSLVVTPGYRAALKSLTEGLPEGTRLVGVGPGRYGATSAAPDGSVTYSPFQGAAGYDWFDYVLDNGRGLLSRGRVTVYIGDLGTVPGVITR